VRQPQRRAVALKTRQRGGDANNTLETYESENALIWNLLEAAGLPANSTAAFCFR
jgi:hypothetical protein